MDSLAETPSSNQFFQVREYGRYISTQHKDIYQTPVAKFVFVICPSQSYIKTAVVLLATSVKRPNMDDYKKLALCIRYIRSKV